MEETPFGKLAHHFRTVEDPRDDNIRHKLLDMIFIAICAIICGADNWVEVEIFGQHKVDEKSNEITAIPKLLELLDIRGCIVTIDAIGTQTKIAKQIIEKGGDYLLAVKENQERLFQDLVGLFSYDQERNFQEAPYQFAKTVNKNHGRIEIRQCWTTSDPEYLNTIRDQQKWKGLKSIVMIIAERITDRHTSTETRYYISSLPTNAE